MPVIEGILETSLYVADLERSAAFYRDLLGFRSLFESRRLIALDAGKQGVLLLFPNNAEIRDVTGPFSERDDRKRLAQLFSLLIPEEG